MYIAEYFSPLYKECTVGNWETCQDSGYYNEKNDSYQTIFASRKEAENVARAWAEKCMKTGKNIWFSQQI